MPEKVGEARGKCPRGTLRWYYPRLGGVPTLSAKAPDARTRLPALAALATGWRPGASAPEREQLKG